MANAVGRVVLWVTAVVAMSACSTPPKCKEWTADPCRTEIVDFDPVPCSSEPYVDYCPGTAECAICWIDKEHAGYLPGCFILRNGGEVFQCINTR